MPPSLASEPHPLSVRKLGMAIGLIAFGIWMLCQFPPGVSGWYPPCLWYRITGYFCPGCGGTRAVYHLLHGHWRLAWEHNALLILALPFLTYWVGRQLIDWSYGRYRPASPHIAFIVSFWLIAAGLFGVLRNLPFEPWKHLAPPNRTSNAVGYWNPRHF